MSLLELLRAERRASVETLRSAGPDAPTLCEGWRARDIAAHLLLQEPLGGVPMALLAPVGMTFMRLGIRTSSRLVRRAERYHDRALKPGWEAVLAKLAAGPPRVAGLRGIGSVRFHEEWIHHEDVRRAGIASPRPSSQPTDDALWSALHWYGKYQRHVLRDVDLYLRRPDGRELRIGDADGDRVVAAGEPGELALFLAGRSRASRIELVGADDAVTRVGSGEVSL